MPSAPSQKLCVLEKHKNYDESTKAEIPQVFRDNALVSVSLPAAFCFAVFKDRFILNSINWANIQATSTTETICRHFLATNKTFSGLQRACLYTETALGTLIFVNSNPNNTELLSYPWNKTKRANELTKRTVDNEWPQQGNYNRKQNAKAFKIEIKQIKGINIVINNGSLATSNDTEQEK